MEIFMTTLKAQLNIQDAACDMQNLSGTLMSGNRAIATVKNGCITDADDNLLPLYLKRTKNMEGWLASRAIDSHRTNSRLLKKALRLRTADDAQTALAVNAATVTDRYWFRPEGSTDTYEDIRFNENYFAEVALRGDPDSFSQAPSRTPELTNIGSFEKCWKLINNEWWMLKKGDEDQIFSELFSSRLAAKLGIPTAIYEYDNGNVRTKNFASNYNFEPMYALCDDEEDYEIVFDILKGLGEEIAKSYLLLLFFDCIVYNVDRHNNNYGVLRDKDNGVIVSLAPNFDDNLSLLAYNKILDQNPKTDPLIKMFVDFLKKRPDALELFKTAEVNRITKEDVTSIFKGIPIQRDETKITNFVLPRYEYLMGIKES